MASVSPQHARNGVVVFQYPIEAHMDNILCFFKYYVLLGTIQKLPPWSPFPMTPPPPLYILPT